MHFTLSALFKKIELILDLEKMQNTHDKTFL